MNTSVLTLDAIKTEALQRGFAAVLEDAGVYKNTPQGREAFLKFVDSVCE